MMTKKVFFFKEPYYFSFITIFTVSVVTFNREKNYINLKNIKNKKVLIKNAYFLCKKIQLSNVWKKILVRGTSSNSPHTNTLLKVFFSLPIVPSKREKNSKRHNLKKYIFIREMYFMNTKRNISNGFFICLLLKHLYILPIFWSKYANISSSNPFAWYKNWMKSHQTVSDFIIYTKVSFCHETT